MNCWHCDRPAHGTCQFCGRAICKEHARSLPHIAQLYHTEQGSYKAFVVAEALYCGLCKPREDPIDLPDLH